MFINMLVYKAFILKFVIILIFSKQKTKIIYQNLRKINVVCPNGRLYWSPEWTVTQ